MRRPARRRRRRRSRSLVSGNAKVTTPQPSIAVRISSVPARRATSASPPAGTDGRAGGSPRIGQPFRAAEGEHPRVLAGAVVLQLRALERPAFEVVLGGRRLREQGAGRPRAAGSSARCDADAIARSRSSRSSRARASGTAWIGFAAERMNVTRSGSPADATISPSRTATACTRWTDSTVSPRSTVTLIGSAMRRL